MFNIEPEKNSQKEQVAPLSDFPVDKMNESVLVELQQSYLLRLSQQVEEIVTGIARLSDHKQADQARLGIKKTLASIVSTATTFGLARLGSIASLMLGTVDQWCTMKTPQEVHETSLFLGHLSEFSQVVESEIRSKASAGDQETGMSAIGHHLQSGGREVQPDDTLLAVLDRCRYFEQMISTSNDMLAMIDIGYRYFAANQAYINQFGLERDEIIGLKVEEIIGRESFRKLLKPKVDRALGGETVHFESWVNSVHKRPMYMDVVYTPYTDQHKTIRGMIVTARDITPIKAAEERFRESEEKFFTIFNNAEIGIAMCRLPDSRFIETNQHLADLLGYTTDELMQLSVKDITHPDDYAASIDHINRMLAGEFSTFSVDKRYINIKTGHKIWAHTSVSHIHSTQDNCDYLIAVIEDITDQKLANKALKESESRYRSLTELSPCGIFRTDKGG